MQAIEKQDASRRFICKLIPYTDYLCDRIRNCRLLNYCEHDFPLTINYVMSRSYAFETRCMYIMLMSELVKSQGFSGLFNLILDQHCLMICVIWRYLLWSVCFRNVLQEGKMTDDNNPFPSEQWFCFFNYLPFEKETEKLVCVALMKV